ncbi:MAG TPA: phosphoribosylaminoimidazolesuccinocarboxamide synthase [Acidobacteriota bacterium]|nr:phosphoribosylaminoimidazolesuccinocarboxamide synthase [Acidobacteriota bacterium]
MSGAVREIELKGIPRFKSGKVREVFDLGDKLLFVASDRISAFDVVLPQGIPDKGAVLTQISAFWFNRMKDIVPNHLISAKASDFPDILQPHAKLLAGRSMLVRKTRVFPVECVVRGYLAGSGWKDYHGNGKVCGIDLPGGLRESDILEEPIFTPATKAESGHDMNISYEEMERIVGAEWARRMRGTSIEIYRRAREYAAARGIIIADTKFEFGKFEGELMLIDEILTPDSSRFWPADSYEPGRGQPSYDKQFVRDYLETLDWDKTPPPPDLPDDVVSKTREKYLEAYKLLTGEDLRI